MNTKIYVYQEVFFISDFFYIRNMLSYYLRWPSGRAKNFLICFRRPGQGQLFRQSGQLFKLTFEGKRVKQQVFFISVGCALGKVFFIYGWSKNILKNPAKNSHETVLRKTYKKKSRQIHKTGSEAKFFFIYFLTVSGKAVAEENTSEKTV